MMTRLHCLLFIEISAKSTNFTTKYKYLVSCRVLCWQTSPVAAASFVFLRSWSRHHDDQKFRRLFLITVWNILYANKAVCNIFVLCGLKLCRVWSAGLSCVIHWFCFCSITYWPPIFPRHYKLFTYTNGNKI